MVAFVWAAATPVAAQSNGAKAFIDNVIEAYGGRQHVLSVRAYRLEANMQAHIRKKNARVTRIVEGPLRLKVLIRYPSRAEVRVLDGKRAWRGPSPSKLALVRGPMQASMVLQAARANLPWILDKMRSQVRLARTKDASPVLEVFVGEGLMLRAFVDARTHRVIRSESLLAHGQMKVRFQAVYSDFRKVDGVLFPFHEENFASGMHTGTTKVRSIQLNPPGAGLELPVFSGHSGGDGKNSSGKP
jgi:hypothetical protein